MTELQLTVAQLFQIIGQKEAEIQILRAQLAELQALLPGEEKPPKKLAAVKDATG